MHHLCQPGSSNSGFELLRGRERAWRFGTPVCSAPCGQKLRTVQAAHRTQLQVTHGSVQAAKLRNRLRNMQHAARDRPGPSDLAFACLYHAAGALAAMTFGPCMRRRSAAWRSVRPSVLACREARQAGAWCCACHSRCCATAASWSDGMRTAMCSLVALPRRMPGCRHIGRRVLLRRPSGSAAATCPAGSMSGRWE